MRRSLPSRPHGLQLAVTIALLVLVPGLATVSAQPTQALIEDWRNADYGFASRMMAATS